MSTVVKRFLLERSPDRHITTMTIDDVEHYSAEEKARIIASYPAHELEARTKGTPVLGSGRIFPVSEESITIEQRDFPSHWAHWRHGLWLGSSLRRRRGGVGSR